MKTCECKHEPKHIVVYTVLKDQVCKKCGITFFYKNYKPLFAVTIILVVIGIALGTYALIRGVRLINDPVIGIIVYLGVIGLIPMLMKVLLRKIYGCFGKKVTMVLPKAEEPILTDEEHC